MKVSRVPLGAAGLACDLGMENMPPLRQQRFLSVEWEPRRVQCNSVCGSMLCVELSKNELGHPEMSLLNRPWGFGP